ncbi:MAG TPA: chaplin [Actinocrinis sp.]|nr:chaplin [Actinocrinis sp.]
MHGFAKRGLALAAATSGLVLGTAGIAAADATATGETAHSGGAASGNVVNAPVAVPVNFCGNQALVVALKNVDEGSMCTIGSGEGALAQGSSEHSGGAGSGNVVDAAVSVPVNACGNQAGVIVAKDKVKPQTCSIGTNGDAPGAIATGASEHSGGLLSGNVVNAAVSVPVNLCGNQADVIGFRNTVDSTTCTIG